MVAWSQGPAFYVLFRTDAERLLEIARDFDATVWITVTRDGAPQPLLMPHSHPRPN